jgi:hypothetical protein
MSNLLDQVEHSLKWKKSADWCAGKIGIPTEEYTELKKQVYENIKKAKKSETHIKEEFENDNYDCKIDLERGEGKISGVSNSEPKTVEEIEKILKIDTKIWKISSYWNKEMSDHWRVSALVSRVKHNESFYFEDLIKNWKPKQYKIPKISLDKDKKEVCGVLSLQDLHFGKEGDNTIDKDFEDTLFDLLTRASAAHYISHLFFVIGGDLINMDTFNGTTTMGTMVENSCPATIAYERAFDAMHWGINFIKQFCDKLTIVYIPGNHDRLTSFHLAHALSKSIIDSDIIWDVEYGERKVHIWNNNFNAFEHGDVPKKNTPLVYATEFSVEWGNTVHRTLFSGHTHTDRKVEYVTSNEKTGFVHKTLPSLSKVDYWHNHNKFIGNKRSGKIELQDPIKGNICELTFTPD